MLASVAVLLLAERRWPSLTAALVLLPVLALVLVPASVVWGLSKGLRLKTRAAWRVESTSEAVIVWRDDERFEVPFDSGVSGLRIVSVESLDSRFLTTR